MTEKIAYEKHPVSPERKAELRAQGFKIIDAQFKPRAAADKIPEADERALLVADLRERGVEFDEAGRLTSFVLYPSRPRSLRSILESAVASPRSLRSKPCW